MKTTPSHSQAADFDRLMGETVDEFYYLKLFISGITPRSSAAIANLKKICEEKLPHRYQLEIIDIYQQPHLAKLNQIIAVPTLIKFGPLPVVRLIGDMSDRQRLLKGLNLQD